jgi:DNA replication protein DnaC
MAVQSHLVLLDDFGAQRLTDWSVDVINNVLDDRYNADLSTIITTNFDPGDKDLEGYVGERLVSRLAENTTFIPIVGPDRRKPT